MSQATIASPAAGLADGIHLDVPNEVYHRIDCFSNSRGNILHSHTPAHLRESIDNGDADKPALILGDATHAFLLEPDRLDRMFAVSTQCAATTGKGTRCSNPGKIGRIGPTGERYWYCGVKGHDIGAGELESRRVLTEEDYAHAKGMRDSIWAHPAARKLLEHAGEIEVTALWHDKETGCRCKMRADLTVDAFDLIADIKTTLDASPPAFERSIFQYGYHRQGAHYPSGMAACGRQYESFVIIAVEKRPPYAVAVYRLRDDVIRAGYEQLRPLIAQYAECKQHNRWPAFNNEIQDIGLPAWSWKQMGLIEGVTL